MRRGRGPCSRVLPQELRRAPGPRRRGPSRGVFSAEFVFGEAEAGGEDAWTAALRQLRSKVRREAGMELRCQRPQRPLLSWAPLTALLLWFSA